MDHSTEYHKDIKPELYVSLDGFEGPLDLLLTLAKKQKVDLKKLQLGILADQFLDYIREQRYKFKLEFAGDHKEEQRSGEEKWRKTKCCLTKGKQCIFKCLKLLFTL